MSKEENVSDFLEALEKYVKLEHRVVVINNLETNSRGMGLGAIEMKKFLSYLDVPRADVERVVLELTSKYNLENKDYDPIARRFVRNDNSHWWSVQMLRNDAISRGICPNDSHVLIERVEHYFCPRCQEKFGTATRAS
jgi:hypothetical protein